MKDFYFARERIEKEAIEFLREGLFAACSENCPRYIHFGISSREKRNFPQEYQQGLSCFKALFQAGETGYRLALWNMIVNYYAPDTKFCKRDFSEEEYAFLREALRAVREPEEANVNPPIQTERLVLRAIEREDEKILVDHFKKDGDFELFGGHRPTNKKIWEFTLLLRRKMCFAIERKADNKLLGYLGLSIKKQTATGLLEYYIFKEERGKGYCKEAVEALARIALKGRLYEPVERVQIGVYGKKAIHLNAVRARISSANLASQRTVESCGFVHEATVHQTMCNADMGWTDEKIYYLTSAMLK